MIIGIFVAIAFLLAVTLLAPKPNVENARASNLGDFQFPRADEGDPVPLFWGTIRLKAPNTIWYGDFKAVAITEKVKSGLFSSKKVTVGYKYYVGIDLALGLGPGVVLRRIWAGKYVAWQGTISGQTNFVINQPDLFGGDKQQGGLQGNVTFYDGTFTQDRDPYLATYCDANVPRYGGVCHAVFKSFYVGTTTSLQAFNFELSRLSDTVLPGKGIMPNGLDVNPMEIIYDALTAKWGRLGMDTALIDVASWQAAAATLYDENNGMSLKLEASNTGKSVADEVMRQIDGLMYQDPENMKIVTKLLRDDYNIDDLPILDMSVVKDLSNFAKTTWDSTFNQCRVTFSNRDKDYEDGVAAAQDFANINFQQRVRSTELSFPGVTVPELASRLASRALGIYSVPLYKCDLKCTRKAASLRPGDVFVLNWEPFNLERMVMRVQKIDLGDLTDGTITMSVIQDKFAANAMVFAPPEQTGWQPIDTTPRPITSRSIIETPYFILQASGVTFATNQGALYVLARKPGAQSQNFDAEQTTDAFATVYLGLDDAPYTPSGRLAADYPATAGGGTKYDTTTGITIDLLDDTSVLLADTTRNNYRDGKGLIVMNGEIMSYAGYTNNGNGSYTLRNISRGFLDTMPIAHTTGDYLFFLPGQDGLSDTLFTDTATVTARLRDNTATATLATGSALTNAVTMARRAFRPACPAYMTANASRTPAGAAAGVAVALAWRERTRLATGLVWYDDATATPEAGTTYRLEVRINGGTWTAVSGATALTTPSFSYTPATAGAYDFRVYASRDSLLSTVADTVSITIT